MLVHLHEEFGERSVEHCNGMFAFCVYDSRRKRLFLARDRVGKKPLFYYRDSEKFVFASEMKSLFADGLIQRRVNKQAIRSSLMNGHVPSPDTAFMDVVQLEPGHYMIVDNDGLSIHRYWNPDYVQRSDPSLEVAKNEYIDLLKTCVKDRLISDVPVGLLLSGGIDSCSIAAMMAEEGISIPTFTLRFDERDKDEGDIAKIMAQRMGSDHQEMFLRMDMSSAVFCLCKSDNVPRLILLFGLSKLVHRTAPLTNS